MLSRGDGAREEEEEGTSPKENEESIRGEATGKGGILVLDL